MLNKNQLSNLSIKKLTLLAHMPAISSLLFIVLANKCFLPLTWMKYSTESYIHAYTQTHIDAEQMQVLA